MTADAGETEGAVVESLFELYKLSKEIARSPRDSTDTPRKEEREKFMREFVNATTHYTTRSLHEITAAARESARRPLSVGSAVGRLSLPNRSNRASVDSQTINQLPDDPNQFASSAEELQAIDDPDVNAIQPELVDPEPNTTEGIPDAVSSEEPIQHLNATEVHHEEPTHDTESTEAETNTTEIIPDERLPEPPALHVDVVEIDPEVPEE